MLKTTYAIAACTIAQFVLLADYGLAVEPANQSSVLAPFVNDDTFVVAHIDVASIKSLEDSIPLLSMMPTLTGDPRMGQLITVINGILRRVQDGGLQGVYIVAGLGDVRDVGGPVMIATAHAGKRSEDLERLFRDIGVEIVNDPSQSALRPLVEQLDVYRKGDAVLVGAKASINRYAAYLASPRADLIEPLAKLTGEGTLAACVFCPGPDFRRVVRELWPEMPGSLAPLRGELADRWQHLEAAINSPPDAKPRLVLEARDVEAAQLFAKLWRNLPTETTEFGDNLAAHAMVKGYAQLLVGSFPAQVDGKRVTIGVPTGESEAVKLSAMFGSVMNASMEKSRRVARMNQFKQLVIAMHNYIDRHESFPPAAIRDKDGKPLLSWRVAILPYIEEDALYKQFHLDEPWDSAHNRPLVMKMPKLFADPDPQGKKLAQEGKTTYVVPVGPETAFYKDEGTKLTEITDGTSHTIAIVEVEPSRAVLWTKPEDWEVDMAHPRRGVERSDRNIFAAARCDGSVHSVPVNIDEKTLRALLTRAGRETTNE